MPELPEVETTVLSLRKKVLNKAFVRVWAENSRKDLGVLIKREIKKIERFGKGIYFFLDDKKILHIHLRMTGHLLLGNWKMDTNEAWKSEEKILQESKNGFLRYIFFLSNNKQLALSDPRKFAKVSLLSEKEFKNYLSKIGKDALKIKKGEFIALFEGKKKEIKPLLMDQSFLSGIGNIYAAEILFQAGIDPRKKTSLLKREDFEKIYDFMQFTLKKALQLKGDSTSDYRLLNGEKGGYQNHHLVYNRKDLPCFVCQKKIKREVVGGRGTYFCSNCQK
jgi:formamidopyrimidine-DNA glycosylase